MGMCRIKSAPGGFVPEGEGVKSFVVSNAYIAANMLHKLESGILQTV